MRRAAYRGVSGFTLTELVVTLALASVLLLLALPEFLSWNARQSVRNGIHTIQAFLRLAQAQAATRNRACRFVLDTATGRLEVQDLNDPANTGDDIVVASATLPSGMAFASPLGDPPVTLEPQPPSAFRTTFAADGSVTSGSGAVFIQANESFNRITVFGAGGTRVETWDGAAWRAGS